MKKKIYHQHIVKSGGTTLNRFLDLQYPADKIHSEKSVWHWNESGFRNMRASGMSKSQVKKSLAQWVFSTYDCVYGHNPYVDLKPEEFFGIIIIRNPLERIISLIQDWKRLSDSDITQRATNEVQALKAMVKSNPIEKIWGNWNFNDPSIKHFSNYQTKVLGLDDENVILSKNADSIKMQRGSMRKINKFDLYGTTDNLNATLNILCDKMGWCPPSTLTRSNRSKNELTVSDQLKDQILSKNQMDLQLYQYAQQNQYPQRNAYTMEDFIQKHLRNRIKSLCPIHLGDGMFIFNMNMPIIGSGFYMREFENTENCQASINHEDEVNLFIPIFPFVEARLMLFFPNPVRVNRCAVDYKKIELEDFRKVGTYLIKSSAFVSTKEFIHVQLSIGSTSKKTALWKYGYQLITR